MSLVVGEGGDDHGRGDIHVHKHYFFVRNNICHLTRKVDINCVLFIFSTGSRYGRRSNWFKIHCLIQDQQELNRMSEQQQQQHQSNAPKSSSLSVSSDPDDINARLTESSKDFLAKFKENEMRNAAAAAMASYANELSNGRGNIQSPGSLRTTGGGAGSPNSSDGSYSGGRHSPYSVGSLNNLRLPLAMDGKMSASPAFPFFPAAAVAAAAAAAGQQQQQQQQQASLVGGLRNAATAADVAEQFQRQAIAAALAAGGVGGDPFGALANRFSPIMPNVGASAGGGGGGPDERQLAAAMAAACAAGAPISSPLGPISPFNSVVNRLLIQNNFGKRLNDLQKFQNAEQLLTASQFLQPQLHGLDLKPPTSTTATAVPNQKNLAEKAAAAAAAAQVQAQAAAAVAMAAAINNSNGGGSMSAASVGGGAAAATASASNMRDFYGDIAEQDRPIDLSTKRSFAEFSELTLNTDLLKLSSSLSKPVLGDHDSGFSPSSNEDNNNQQQQQHNHSPLDLTKVLAGGGNKKRLCLGRTPGMSNHNNNNNSNSKHAKLMMMAAAALANNRNGLNLMVDEEGEEEEEEEEADEDEERIDVDDIEEAVKCEDEDNGGAADDERDEEEEEEEEELDSDIEVGGGGRELIRETAKGAGKGATANASRPRQQIECAP